MLLYETNDLAIYFAFILQMKTAVSLWDDKSVLIAPSLRVMTYRIKVLRAFVGVDTRNRMALVKVNSYYP